MASDRTILITGVTGKQGGAVAQALQGSGFHLRGLTRVPDGERATALARQGIDIVKGDFDDEATLRRALAGAWGVFAVQNAGEAGAERVEAQGKRLAALAREAGVEHFVYTSVESAHKRTGVPHFDDKWRIEETVRSLNFPSHVILRPVFFMENLLAPFSLQGSTLAWALGPGTKAADDCGGRYRLVWRPRLMWGTGDQASKAIQIDISSGNVINMYSTGTQPVASVFDGHNLWTANSFGASITKIPVR